MSGVSNLGAVQVPSDIGAGAAGSCAANQYETADTSSGPTCAYLLPPKAAIASLPGCVSATEGMHGVATDCNAACSAGGTCTTGGAINCEMYCNGSTWKETGL